MSTRSLSLDLNQLAQRFMDLQQIEGTIGWSDKDGQALYFISAGSEYRLWLPKTLQTSAPLSSAAIDTYQHVLDQMQDWVNENLGGSAQSDQLARIAAARDELSSNSPHPMLTITTTIDHIRGAALDDHAAVSIVVFWCDALQIWLPEDIEMGFSWGTSTVAVPENAMQKLNLPSSWTTLARMGLKRIPVVGWAVQLESIVQYTCRAWNFAVSVIAKMADDGGRLYFSVVVSDAIARILQSIIPAISETVESMMTPDLLRLGRQWIANYDKSLYTMDSYRFFASVIAQEWSDTLGDKYTNDYSVTLPDLVYLPGGGATMLSFKMTAVGNAVFAVITMLFAAEGQLLMVSGTVQFLTGTIASSPPIWATDGMYPNYMFQQMLETLFNEDTLPIVDPDNIQRVMPDALMAFLQALNSSTRAMLVSSSTLLNALPPLPVVRFTAATAIATGMQRPAVTVAGSGYGVVVCVDSSGEDALWEITISSSASGVSKSSAQSSSYQGGQDPALALYADDIAVEVHGGNGNNKLYYNLITLSGSTVTTPDNGDNYDKGENPAVAVAGSRAYEFHRGQTSGDNTLYYEVGSISSKSVDWSGSGTKYAEGDNVAVSPCPNYWNLVTAHVRSSTIYTINAAVNSGSASITFGDEATLGDGDGPAVAVLSNQFVLVFHQGTGDYSNMLCSSIGLWSPDSIQWIVSGVQTGLGGFPAASRRSDDTVVVIYENNDGKGGINGRVASLSVPAGFV